MPTLCAHSPCKCVADDDEIFCSDVCAMLGAQLIHQVAVTSAVPLREDSVVPRCACGHEGCGDSLVSDRVN